MRNLPSNTVDLNTEEMIDLYSRAYIEIVKLLVQGLDYKKNPNFSKQSMYSMMKQVESTLDQLGVDIAGLVSSHTIDAVEKGYLESVVGYFKAEGLTGVALATAILNFPFSGLANDLALQLAKDTFKDLLQANNNTSLAIQQLIRDAFVKHMSVGALLNKGYKDMAESIIKEITGESLKLNIANGIITIVDKAGRKWKLNTYIEMVVKTKYQQALVSGMKEFTKETGEMDLARIPTNGARDMCRIYEGLVISMTGSTRGYKTYDELQATNQIFHPRCKHLPSPIKSIDHLPDDEKMFHEMLNGEMGEYLKNKK